jgi:hypothetical protein
MMWDKGGIKVDQDKFSAKIRPPCLLRKNDGIDHWKGGGEPHACSSESSIASCLNAMNKEYWLADRSMKSTQQRSLPAPSSIPFWMDMRGLGIHHLTIEKGTELVELGAVVVEVRRTSEVVSEETVFEDFFDERD